MALKAASREQKRDMLLGSEAVATGVKLCRPQVIAAYPITPQTHIIETLSEMVAQGELQAKYIKVESEMSAIAACFGAVAAGSRAFTATSSHGLALMHEMLHWFSGARFPMVLVNANRALGAPWNIWTDQGDSFAQRDTGWLQLYSETAQEALDNIILAYWLSEQIMLPVMVMIDGFILSHTMEPLFIPSQAQVDAFLPPYVPPYCLDINNPFSFGAAATADNFYLLKKNQAKTMRKAELILKKGYTRFEDLFGRHYDHAQGYSLEDTETVILTCGALCGTVQVALNQLARQGKKVGLVKLRLVRPFPKQTLQDILQDKKEILVLSRACSFGAGGSLAQELRAALYGYQNKAQIYDLVVSLGGKEVFPQDIIDVLENLDQLSTTDSNWF